MGYSTAIFPDSVAFGSTAGVQTQTHLVVTQSGQEEATPIWSAPRATFNAAYGVKSYEDMADIVAFYVARRGPVDSFRFRNWLDCNTSSNRIHPTLAFGQPQTSGDVLLGQGDGATLGFQLLQKYTSGDQTVYKKITKPEETTVLVDVDGVRQVEDTDFTVNYETGLITFMAAPGAGLDVTAGCLFYHHVRFDFIEDETLNINYDDFDASSTNIPLLEMMDQEEVPTNYWYGGGKNYGTVGADIVLASTSGRAIKIDPSQAIDVFLPLADKLPMGGTWFVIENEGSFAITLKTFIGTTITTIPAGEVRMVWLGEDDTQTREWIVW